MLLPGCNAAEAAARARRMADALRVAEHLSPGGIRPTLSIGIATARVDDDYESLWLRADSALYVAKRDGRDRIAQEEDADGGSA